MSILGSFRFRQLGFVLTLAAFTWIQQSAAVRAEGRSDLCSEVCGENVDCDTHCIPAPEDPNTTCGEYDGGESNGWCTESGPPTCTPNYQPIDEDIIGALEVDNYPYYCEYNRYSVVTYADQNSCQGSSNYEACVYYNAGSIGYPPSTGYCCSFFGWCGGTFTCPV
jgi:hypothetical protein